MDDGLIGFFGDQLEGMCILAMKEDNKKRQQVMPAIANTYCLLHDQFVELGKVPRTT